jgi:phosphotransferase system HPr-like phosphotransfer protein
MSHLLQLYAVISMEIYSGNSTVDQLRSIIGFEYFLELPDEDVDKAEANLKKFSAKYTVNLRETLIDVADWQVWFEKGIFDNEKVNSTLMKSLYFQNENTPEWKKLLGLYDLEQGEFNKLKISARKSFANFEIREFGAIKQLVGIYLYLAEVNLIDESPKEILRNAKAIVKQAIDAGKLNIPDSLSPEDDFGSYEGYAYFSEDKAEFNQFSDFFNNEIYSYQAKNRENEAPDILKLMASDVSKFTELMCNQTGEDETFVYKAVLHAIPTDTFIKTIKSLSNSNKKFVCQALRNRYKNQKGPAMKPEVEWIKGVIDNIDLLYAGDNSLDSLVMIKFAEWIKPHL